MEAVASAQMAVMKLNVVRTKFCNMKAENIGLPDYAFIQETMAMSYPYR